MTEIPHAVLSDQLEGLLQGRRLVTAMFLTFRFDPGFFEIEVLPALLDVPLSHAVPIRRIQLEDALRQVAIPPAVYYDANGLHIGDECGAKLDIKRIPIRHPTGIFHPKNVFILVEDSEPDDAGLRARTLLVVTLSANLTRAGWWENVETFHVEELAENAKTLLRDDLLSFLERIRQRAPHESGHEALDAVRGFVRGTRQRANKSTDGLLHPRLYGGKLAFVDWLDEAAGSDLRGMNLEVISPYFDTASTCGPLEGMIERFSPREVRVLTPRDPQTGEGCCSPELYESIRALPGVSWGRLPKDRIAMAKSEQVSERFVHAKAYRFFDPKAKREIVILGSVNLTRAAHSSTGNLESAILVEIQPPHRPEFWLSTDSKSPTHFSAVAEDEGASTTSGSRLVLRYEWDTGRATAYWDDKNPSAALGIRAQNIPVAELPPLEPKTWTQLASDEAARLREALTRTSLVTVIGDRPEPVQVLVQEEGMPHKPSILMSLSVAEILEYWALLTPAQRAAFIENRAPELSGLDAGGDLTTRVVRANQHNSLFDRFAGIFHAFGCLERNVRVALEEGNQRDAVYRLFGKKYDSLWSLLNQVSSEDADPVDRYVVVLSAKQMLDALSAEAEFNDFLDEHASSRKELATLVAELAASLRAKLIAKSPESMPDFLDWFDSRFVPRATPVAKHG